MTDRDAYPALGRSPRHGISVADTAGDRCCRGWAKDWQVPFLIPAVRHAVSAHALRLRRSRA